MQYSIQSILSEDALWISSGQSHFCLAVKTALTVDVPFEKYESFCQAVLRLPQRLSDCLLIHQQIICHCKHQEKVRHLWSRSVTFFQPVCDSMMETKPSISEIRAGAGLSTTDSSPFTNSNNQGRIETITMGLHLCSLGLTVVDGSGDGSESNSPLIVSEPHDLKPISATGTGTGSQPLQPRPNGISPSVESHIR